MAASSLLCCTALSIMGLGLRLQTSERADEGGVTATSASCDPDCPGVGSG